MSRKLAENNHLLASTALCQFGSTAHVFVLLYDEKLFLPIWVLGTGDWGLGAGNKEIRSINY